LRKSALVLTAALAVVLVLSACGTIGFGKFRKDTKTRAADSAEDRPLEMPPPLVLTREQPTASGQAPRPAEPVAPAPSPVARAPSAERQPRDWNAPAQEQAGAGRPAPVFAEEEPATASGESVSVEGELAAVHRQVREFWQELGVAIARDDAKSGIINTGWIAGYPDLLAGRPVGGEVSEIQLDRFSVSLTPGTAPKTTRVVVRHEGMRERQDASGAQLPWESRSDPRLEQITIERLRVHLGA